MGKIIKNIGLSFLFLGLVACGGGGSGSSGFSNPEPIKVTITAQKTTLPANLLGSLPDPHSPFTIEVTVEVRRADGSPIANGTPVQMQVDNVAVGGVTKLDDPDTSDFDEFRGCRIENNVVVLDSCTLFASLDNQTSSGKATYFFTSGSQPGTARLTATVTDPNSGKQIEATLDITVISTAGTGLPALIAIDDLTRPVYMQGLNAPDTVTLQAGVMDASGLFIADPPAGVNNVRVEIMPGSPGGLRLEGTSASGVVQGGAIAVRTLSGVVAVNLISGPESGIAVIRFTADRADNDVDNGLQDPVFDEIQIPISDGKLASIAFADSLIAEAHQSVSLDGVTLLPNGSLSRIISVVTADRFGNPPVPDTPIVFGLVDSPTRPASSGCGESLAMAGTDGDPLEGGNRFTALRGRFLINGGRSRDLLLYAAQQDPLQTGGRVVDAILDNQNLTIVTTGLSPFETVFNAGPDAGPVADYVLGRPVRGNIESPQRTDEHGIATTRINYANTFINQPVRLVAQGLGADNKTVGAVLDVLYAGIGPGVLTGNPTQFNVDFECLDADGDGVCEDTPSGVDVAVFLRLIDAVGNPIPNNEIIPSVSGADPAIVSGLLDFYCTDRNGTAIVSFTILPCGNSDCSSDTAINWLATSAANATEVTDITSSVTVTSLPPTEPLTVTPASLSLSGNPGETVSQTLNIAGGVAPYAIGVTGVGGVNPASLPAPGSVIYSFTIPATAAPGDVFTAQVQVSDAEGRTFTVPVQIVVSAGNVLLADPSAIDLTFGDAGLTQDFLVTLTLRDAQGAPVVGETITGVASGAVSGTEDIVDFTAPPSDAGPATCTTDALGQCTVAIKVKACALNCVLDATITWTGGDAQAQTTIHAVTQVTSIAPLSVTPTSLALSGNPGETVSQTLNIAGGVAPYAIGVTGVGGVNPASLPAPGSVIYTFTIPATAAPGDVFTAQVQVSDAQGSSVLVPVQITVLAGNPLAVSPSSVSLSGNPGETVSQTLNIAGGVAPYAIGVTGVGSVNPASLPAPGSVIYTFTIPATAAPGDTFADTILVQDSGAGTVQVPVLVTAQ